MNTDKQPQIEKTAAEFLFESGIDTMSLNDDFNCQLLFAMERYAEYYTSHQKDIKIDDKVAFNYTDKQPQTEEKCIAGCKTFYGGEKKHHKDCPFYPDSLSEYYDKRYCFTPEELQALKAEWQMEAIISDRKLLRQHDCFKVPLLPKPITPTT